jgi:multidrug efflux pump subunit AcrA (membrane-fusion protein)
VERAREQVQYKLGLQQNLRRAEALARRAQLERAVEGVQARLALKLTEERANLQAAQVRQPASCAANLQACPACAGRSTVLPGERESPLPVLAGAPFTQ